VTWQKPLPHLASPQLQRLRSFPVVEHRPLPHLAPPHLHLLRSFPVVEQEGMPPFSARSALLQDIDLDRYYWLRVAGDVSMV